MKKKIIYIGDFEFPHGNAASQLVYTNGKIFRELGYDVIFIGNSKKLKRDVKFLETENQFDDFKYYTIIFQKKLTDIKNEKLRNNSIISLFNLFAEDIEAVICYGSPSFATLVYIIMKWCKRNNVFFIGNVADISALTHGFLPMRLLKLVDKTILRLIFKYKCDGVISVSKYIKEYFSHGKNTVIVVPPLVDYRDLPRFSIKRKNKIDLVYAGIPFPVDGRKVDISSYKDRLDIVIILLSYVHKINKNFIFNIYGITKEEYLSVVRTHKDVLNEMSETVIFHGKTDYASVLNYISKADFTINLRDVNRMTTAGFSTKFVESISCGTPVITTDTSDLSKYLVEGNNGYFINKDNQVDSIKKMLMILNLEKEKIQEMKRYCYESRLFDYNNYCDEIGLFLSNLQENSR